MSPEEQALLRAKKANTQILIGMAALLMASLNTTKMIQSLAEVIKRGAVSEAREPSKTTQQALESMVEEYSESVN